MGVCLFVVSGKYDYLEKRDVLIGVGNAIVKLEIVEKPIRLKVMPNAKSLRNKIALFSLKRFIFVNFNCSVKG